MKIFNVNIFYVNTESAVRNNGAGPFSFSFLCGIIISGEEGAAGKPNAAPFHPRMKKKWIHSHFPARNVACISLDGYEMKGSDRMRGFGRRLCAWICAFALLISWGGAATEFSPLYAALSRGDGLHAEISGRLDALSPLSDASLQTVNAWLSRLSVFLDANAPGKMSAEGAAVYMDGEKLFSVFIQRMEGGTLTAFSPSGGAYWTDPDGKDALTLLAGDPMNWNLPSLAALPDLYARLASQLYPLLAERATPRVIQDSTSVKNALSSPYYENYAFKDSELNEIWPRVLDILLPAVREWLAVQPAWLRAAEGYLTTLTFSGDCRFKRLLDKNGGDMGMQFTGQITAQGLDKRKVTLFGGSTPGRGGYISLSLPAVKGKNSLKISFGARLTEKDAVNTLTFEGAYSHTLDGVSASAEAEGTLKNALKNGGEQWSGKATLQTNSNGKKAAWTVTPDIRSRDGALSGTVTVQKKVGSAVKIKGEIQVLLSSAAGAAPVLAAATVDLRGMEEADARARVLGEMAPLSRVFLGLMTVLPEKEKTLLTHEMEQVGDLIAVRHRDTGVMEAGMQALLVGSVNSVKAPYAYEIGLGISVKDVELTPEEDGITVSVPAARVLYDSFQITGEPEISDFWHLLGEENYQRLVDDQAAACRREYEDDPEILEEAWRAACGELSRLFAQWAGRDVPLRFTAASAADDPGAQ